MSIRWAAADLLARGSVIGTLADPAKRKVIGAHAGAYAYALHRALGLDTGAVISAELLERGSMRRTWLRDRDPAAARVKRRAGTKRSAFVVM